MDKIKLTKKRKEEIVEYLINTTNRIGLQTMVSEVNGKMQITNNYNVTIEQCGWLGVKVVKVEIPHPTRKGTMLHTLCTKETYNHYLEGQKQLEEAKKAKAFGKKA